MQYSIIKLSECSKYDFGHFLFSPEFFLNDKITCWKTLEKQSQNKLNEYYWHIKNIVNKIYQQSICYDLTDGIPKFFDNGTVVENIGSTKKIAQKDDFLISRMRSYLEEMGIVEERKKEQLFSTEFLVFRAKNNNISTHTLFALCMTKFVQTILKRGQYGTEHPRFYEFLLTNLPIPTCLFSIDKSIKKIIGKALEIRIFSRELYQEAEKILLAELGLANWKAKHRLWFVANYSDTQEAERIDAEYFQPKYDEIIDAIKSYSGGWDTLGNIVSVNDKNFKPKDEKKYRYIELSNIGGNGEITNITTEEGQYLPTRARRIVLNGNIIVSSIEGSLSSIALIEKEYDNALCSTGFFVINSEFLNSKILLVLLKSIVGQLQLKKGCKGTILTAISKDELNKIILPKISKETQTKIQQKIEESFRLRKQSKQLLENAKRTVEIAIEKDEKTATQWLEKTATQWLEKTATQWLEKNTKEIY